MYFLIVVFHLFFIMNHKNLIFNIMQKINGERWMIIHSSTMEPLGQYYVEVS